MHDEMHEENGSTRTVVTLTNLTPNDGLDENLTFKYEEIQQEIEQEDGTGESEGPRRTIIQKVDLEPGQEEIVQLEQIGEMIHVNEHGEEVQVQTLRIISSDHVKHLHPRIPIPCIISEDKLQEHQVIIQSGNIVDIVEEVELDSSSGCGREERAVPFTIEEIDDIDTFNTRMLTIGSEECQEAVMTNSSQVSSGFMSISGATDFQIPPALVPTPHLGTAAFLGIGSESSEHLPFGFQGQGLNSQSQKLVLNVWHFFKYLKKYPETLDDKNAQALAGDALNVGTKTIGRIGKKFRDGKISFTHNKKKSRVSVREALKGRKSKKKENGLAGNSGDDESGEDAIDDDEDESPVTKGRGQRGGRGSRGGRGRGNNKTRTPSESPAKGRGAGRGRGRGAKTRLPVTRTVFPNSSVIQFDSSGSD